MRVAGVLAILVLSAMFALPAGAQTPRNPPSPSMLDGRHLIVTIAVTSPRDAARRLRELAERYPVAAITDWPLGSIALHCLVVRVNDGVSVPATMRRIVNEPGVRWVQPVYGFTVSTEGGRAASYERQRALAAMNVERAHRMSTGARVRVAVIDTGVDAAHPSLSRRVAQARDFVDDGRGIAREGHGTAVAGVLAADGRGERGMLGVAPDARILALRACWEAGGSGRCTSFSLARALNFAIAQRVAVINLSLGGPNDPLLRELIEQALASGIVVVSAAGGGFPADVPGVIAAARSGGGVAAPGTDVLTTLPGGRYGFRSGSSISAAHVSGVVALMKQSRPGAAPSQIQRGLASAARRPVLDACVAVASVFRGRDSGCQ